MRLTTAGESHGKALVAIVEGIPARLRIDEKAMEEELLLRGGRLGRSVRQDKETAPVEILSGVREGLSLGSPICLLLPNVVGADEEWTKRTTPRPGHADYAGMQKFGTDNARFVLERASARETAIRVASGSIFKGYLRALEIEIAGRVCSVGKVVDERFYTFEQLQRSKNVPLGILDEVKEREAEALVQEAMDEGTTLGGVVEVRVKNLKSGFGSCMTYEEKLDGLLASHILPIQLCKGVEFGEGKSLAYKKGNEAQDELFLGESGVKRNTNRLGGIEGGMSNGEEIQLFVFAKPVPTQKTGLRTVDLKTNTETTAFFERSDCCPIFAFERVVESAVAECLAKVVSRRLGGDTMEEVIERYQRLPR